MQGHFSSSSTREVGGMVLTKDQRLAIVFATIFISGLCLVIPFHYTGITYADLNLIFIGDFFAIEGVISGAIVVYYYTHVKELPEIKNQENKK